MAKGQIKKLVNPWGSYSWTRLGKTLELVPLELDRGDGKYLGLPLDTGLDILEDISSKSEEILKDEKLRSEQFLAKVNGMFNSLVFRPLWRESVESFPLGTDLSDTQKASILSAFADRLSSYFAETTTREKGSAFYYKAAAEKAKAIKPLKEKAQGKLANLSAEEQASFKTLKAEYEALIQQAKEKELEEQSGLLDDLDDIA